MKLIGLAALVAGLAIANSASANLIVDGYFDNSSVPASPGYTTYSAGQSFTITTGSVASDGVGGWTVAGGTVDLIGDYWTSPGKGGSVDLDGYTVGAISQAFATTDGQSYTVTFDLSANPNGAPATKTISVSNGALSEDFSVGNGISPPNSISETYSFVASGAQTTLTFASTDSTLGASGFYNGPVLSNVSVTAAPEPATWALMIFGAGVIGGAFRRYAARSSGSVSAV